MEIKAVPKASPSPLPELAMYLAPFAALFRRSLTRQSVERYLTGLLTDLPRKNCEMIAAAVAGTSTERLQYLLTDANWDPVALDRLRVEHLVDQQRAPGTLALDDTTFPKQGRASVGVSRQYCGVLGKIANCQTVVTAHFIADDVCTATPIHYPISARLFLPERWLNDTGRRSRTGIPPDLQTETKHEIALVLIDQARAWQVPFQLVLADAGYGHSADFLIGLDQRELVYACGVDKNLGVRFPHEVQATPTTEPDYGGRGRPRKPHPAPLHLAEDVLAALPEDDWQTVTWRVGSQGPMQKQFAALRMHWGRGLAARTTADRRVYTSPEGWLIGERPLPGTDGPTKYYFSTLEASTPLPQLAATVRGRWPIEQFYEEAKEGCGLGDYQGRGWEGLHRHVALAMLAYCFLVQQRRGESAAAGDAKSGAQPRRSLPAVQRQIMVWLLQDLVQWWIATDHVRTFRPHGLAPPAY